MTALDVLEVGDPAPVWSAMGFRVEAGVTRVDGIEIRLDRDEEGEGILAWSVGGLSIDGLSVAPPAGPGAEGDSSHPNGVIGLDHVVLSTPDIDRTIDAFEGSGVPLRRTRDVGNPGTPMMQAFFRLDNTVVEVVGAVGRSEPGPTGFYGLAFTVGDLEETAACLGDLLRPPRQAVQEGRRIATLDRAAGSSVAIAFMTARPPRPA